MRNSVTYTSIDGQIYNSDSCTPLEAAWKKNELKMQTLARGTYPGTRLNDEELTNIKSIGYWNAQSVQSWGLDYHRNEGIEI